MRNYQENEWGIVYSRPLKAITTITASPKSDLNRLYKIPRKQKTHVLNVFWLRKAEEKRKYILCVKLPLLLTLSRRILGFVNLRIDFIVRVMYHNDIFNVLVSLPHYA